VTKAPVVVVSTTNEPVPSPAVTKAPVVVVSTTKVPISSPAVTKSPVVVVQNTTKAPVVAPVVAPTPVVAPAPVLAPTPVVIVDPPTTNQTVCALQNFTTTVFTTYEALVVMGGDTIREDQVEWRVSFAKTSTTFEYSVPSQSTADELAARVQALPAVLDNTTNALKLELPDFTNGCGNQDAFRLKVTLPRTAISICVGDGDMADCRLVLCPLGSSEPRLKVRDSTAVSFAPGNAAALFGTSKDCQLVKPNGWDDVWNATQSGAVFADLLLRADHDNDGASNIVEFYGAGFISSLYTDLSAGAATTNATTLNGTNPFDPDSDGDLLLDSYELLFDLDPWTANNGTADVDGDTLDLSRERNFGTNPFLADSDGDGVSDVNEVNNGTDAMDDRSFQSPSLQNTRATLGLNLTVGDHSLSESERYILQVGNVEHQATLFGVIDTATYQFPPGTYTVTVRHRDSICATPDYDYTASITIAAPNPNWEVTISDPSRLLGEHYDSTFDRTIGLTAAVTLLYKADKCGNITRCSDCVKGLDCEWIVATKTCSLWTAAPTAGTRSSQVGRSIASPEQCPCERCKAWHGMESRALNWITLDTPQCPCNVKLATDPNVAYRGIAKPMDFLEVPINVTSGVEWSTDGGCNPETSSCTHHPGASGCLLGKFEGGNTSTAGNQCCYAESSSGPAGTLEYLSAGRAAGTPNRHRVGDSDSNTNGTIVQHYFNDVLPYEHCCNECEIDDYCSYYGGGSVDGTNVTGARQDPRGCYQN
jgi:hypothetical protein